MYTQRKMQGSFMDTEWHTVPEASLSLDIKKLCSVRVRNQGLNGAVYVERFQCEKTHISSNI